jgi:threonyl-tRNA synthetase
VDTQNTRFDHRELQKGKQKWPQQGDGFFEFFPHDVGAGLPFWLPKAAFVREQIEQFWREEHRKRDYRIVFTPHIGKTDLWETSGHLQYFKDQMYEGIRLISDFWARVVRHLNRAAAPGSS